MKINNPCPPLWKLALPYLLAVGLLIALPMFLHAVTNSVITIHDDSGQVVQIPVPDSFGALLEKWGGWAASIMVIARIALKFLPAPQQGSTNAWIVWLLKHVSLTTPEKHIEDVPLKKPETSNPMGGVQMPPEKGQP